MSRKIRKAVFPVAGLGTRFLPATKSMPKELLPVVDKPVIHYAVDEARAAGIEQFIFVTSRGKTAMEDHFDRAPELERMLREKGREDGLRQLADATVNSGDMVFVRQQEPLGLGHAIWCARHIVGDEPFAVLLPDDIVFGERSCVAQLVEAYEHLDGGHVIGVQEVPRAQTRKYGVIDPGEEIGHGLIRARGVVEKPEPEDAPSNIAVIGRYVLEPTVFPWLDRKAKGAGGEIQLTDAIAASMEDTPLHGCRFEGVRYDCGDKLGFLKANIAFALQRPDLREGLEDFMRCVLAESHES